LQGSLGALNDIEVHKRLAVMITHPRKHTRKQAEKALAMGFIAGQEQQQIASRIAVTEKAGGKLPKSAKFWRVRGNSRQPVEWKSESDHSFARARARERS
jgi:hypothetical protein